MVIGIVFFNTTGKKNIDYEYDYEHEHEKNLDFINKSLPIIKATP